MASKPETLISKSIQDLLDIYEKQKKLVYTRTNSWMVKQSRSNGYGRVPSVSYIHLCREWWSDITVLLQGGAFLAIEVKTPTGKLEHSQEKMIDKIEALGGLYLVARSAKEVKEYLDTYFQEN